MGDFEMTFVFNSCCCEWHLTTLRDIIDGVALLPGTVNFNRERTKYDAQSAESLYRQIQDRRKSEDFLMNAMHMYSGFAQIVGQTSDNLMNIN